MFRNVCVFGTGDAAAPVAIEHWVEGELPAGLGANIVLAANWLRGGVSGRFVYQSVKSALRRASVNSAGLSYRAGLTVLASYYGAENFGHQLFDNWAVFEFLRHDGSAAMAGDIARCGQVSASGVSAGDLATLVPPPGSCNATAAQLMLVQSCQTYDYMPGGSHLSVSEHAASCLMHEARIFPLTDFSALTSPLPTAGARACVEYLVAGNGDGLGYGIPAEAQWAFRNAVYRHLGLDAIAGPLSPRVLILVKTSISRTATHATWEAALALSENLTDAGFGVDVEAAFGPNDTLKAQVSRMANYSHVILPGGGGGFIAMLAAHGTHILIAAYKHSFEREKLQHARCFIRLTFLDITANRTFDAAAVLAAVNAPPALTGCNLRGYEQAVSSICLVC